MGQVPPPVTNKNINPINIKDMITYEAIIEETEKSFKSTRKADIKKWAKEQVKNGAECVDIYSYYKSPCADTLGQSDYCFVGSIFSNGETSFR